MRLRHATMGFAAAVAATFATGAVAQEEIIFGISAAPGSLQEQTASEFARRANEKLGDVAVVKVFDSSQLGKDKDMLQKIKLGTMHLTLPSSTMPEIAPEYALFGEVVDGCETTVEQMAAAGTPDGVPSETIEIQSIHIVQS